MRCRVKQNAAVGVSMLVSKYTCSLTRSSHVLKGLDDVLCDNGWNKRNYRYKFNKQRWLKARQVLTEVLGEKLEGFRRWRHTVQTKQNDSWVDVVYEPTYVLARTTTDFSG